MIKKFLTVLVLGLAVFAVSCSDKEEAPTLSANASATDVASVLTAGTVTMSGFTALTGSDAGKYTVTATATHTSTVSGLSVATDVVGHIGSTDTTGLADLVKVNAGNGYTFKSITSAVNGTTNTQVDVTLVYKLDSDSDNAEKDVTLTLTISCVGITVTT